MENLDLANEIKKNRLSKSWSQAQLAEIAGLSLRTIQRAENSGKCSQESLLAIASAFDVDVELFTKFQKSPAKSISFDLFKDVSLKTISIVGLILVFPAFYFALTNILKYNLNIDFLPMPWEGLQSNPKLFFLFNNLSPVIFLGGLAAALLINLFSILRIEFSKNPDHFIGKLILIPKTANLAVVCASAFIIVLMLGYAFVENFGFIFH